MNNQAKICVVLMGLLAGAGALMGEVYRVAMPSAGGDDGKSGLDWTAPKASISNALAQGDVTEVWVSNGAYTLAAQIYVNQAVTIRSWKNGAVDPDGTIIDGDNQNRCFEIRHADAVIDGFTITRGLVTAEDGRVRGGGIYMTAGLVTNCLVISNTAHARLEEYGGGGVCLYDGGELWNCRIHENIVTNPPTTTSLRQIGGGVLVLISGKLVNCDIVGNQCFCALRGGGGVALYKGGILDNCTIVSNYADNGGGIYAEESGIITNCRVTGNTGALRAGGLYIYEGKAGSDIGVLTTDCLISNNIAVGTSASGGGVSINNGTNHVMRNCRLVNNIAERDGGGMHASSCGLLMENSLVADNECHGANAGGGGIIASASETNMIMIRNVEIRGNKGSDTGAWGGGGAHLKNAWMENCVIENNYAIKGSGGGIFATGTSTVINCHIISNQAARLGGGISAQNYCVIRNCLIAGNLGSNRFGGGIYAHVNELGEISNCTIIDNEIQGTQSHQRGAGICVVGANRIYNCLVWSNRWSGTVNDEERDMGMYQWDDLEAESNSVHYCCSPRDFGGVRGNTTNPPSFVGAADGDWRLTAGSAGINAGTNLPWMLEPGAVDLNGRPRRDRFSRQADMGCFELVPAGVMFSIR